MIGDNVTEKKKVEITPETYEKMQEEFIEEGLVEDLAEISETLEYAALILSHFCNDRCQIRVGSGDGPENFKCRKPHNVRDTPNY